MTARQALASALHLFVVFAFFAAGFFFFSLPYLPEVQTRAADFILVHAEKCTQVGFGFFIAALVLLVGFYALNRGRHLRIKMGNNLAEIDVEIIRQAVAECFKVHFPKKINLSEVEIPRGVSLEIAVSLAPLDEGEQEELFRQAEKHLQTLLRERFGYSKPFHLIVKI